MKVYLGDTAKPNEVVCCQVGQPLPAPVPLQLVWLLAEPCVR